MVKSLNEQSENSKRPQTEIQEIQRIEVMSRKNPRESAQSEGVIREACGVRGHQAADCHSNRWCTQWFKKGYPISLCLDSQGQVQGPESLQFLSDFCRRQRSLSYRKPGE